MKLARDRTREEILIKIARAKKLKNNIYDLDKSIRERHEKGDISYWEYEQELNRQLGGKNKKEWLNYYDSYISDLRDRLPERKLNNTWLVLSILLIMERRGF